MSFVTSLCVFQETKMKSMPTIPVRALLCSYKCFNSDGHAYYGVATR